MSPCKRQRRGEGGGVTGHSLSLGHQPTAPSAPGPRRQMPFMSRSASRPPKRGIPGRLQESPGKCLSGCGPVPTPGELNSKKDRVSGKDRLLEKGPQGLGKPLGPSRRLEDSRQTAGPFLGREALPPCWHPRGLQRKPPVYSLFGLVALEIFNSLKEDLAPGPELTGSLSPREGLLLHIPLPFEAHPREGSFPPSKEPRADPPPRGSFPDRP